MGLEEILRKKNRIVLLESLNIDASKIREQARELELELEDIFEKQYKVEIKQVGEDLLLDNFGINSNDLVIINSQDEAEALTNIKGIISSKKLYDNVKKEHPEAKYLVLSNYIYGRLSEGSPAVAQALNLVLTQIMHDSDNQEFLDSFIGVKHDLFKRQTLSEYLESELALIRHRIGNERNNAFVSELSERFMDGNSQTGIDKTFLIISNRFNKLNGKFDVVTPDSRLEEIDFSKYAAVFIDNNYNFKNRGGSSRLGEGVNVLRRLREIKADIPVLYQTAHRLEDFTEEEINSVTRYANTIFMPKNRGFKITSVSKAKKEIAIDEIIQQEKILSRYCVKTHKIGAEGYIQNGNDAIIATEAVRPDSEFYYRTGLKKYSHKLEVLAVFHSRMKNEINNPVFNHGVPYLRSWRDIKKGIGDKIGDDKINERKISLLYKKLVRKHNRAKPTTIIHNDAKWDNWFNGYVLGDFGDACAGTEYKDIARALLDKETGFKLVCEDEFVNKSIDGYIESRKKFDAGFKTAKGFYKNVKEFIFIEALRLARSKTQIPGNEEIVNGLLKVGKYYCTGLLNSDLSKDLSVSYNKIPNNGETAPYIRREISI